MRRRAHTTAASAHADHLVACEAASRCNPPTHSDACSPKLHELGGQAASLLLTHQRVAQPHRPVLCRHSPRMHTTRVPPAAAARAKAVARSSAASPAPHPQTPHTEHSYLPSLSFAPCGAPRRRHGGAIGRTIVHTLGNPFGTPNRSSQSKLPPENPNRKSQPALHSLKMPHRSSMTEHARGVSLNVYSNGVQ